MALSPLGPTLAPIPSSATSWKTELGLMPGLEPFGIASKGQGEKPNPGTQFAFTAALADFIDVCKGGEVVMPEIWEERWIPAAQHP